MIFKNTLFTLIALCIYCSSVSATNVKALIIEGTASYHNGSFMALKRNLNDWQFDLKQYATNNDFGSGLEIHIEDLDLLDYDLVLISVHQGTFSSSLLAKFTEYVSQGGRLFLVYQSFPKYYFSESMELNSNALLKSLNIDDKVVFDYDESMLKQYGSIQVIDNDTRLINSSRLNTLRIKKGINKDLSPFKAMMNPGHFYHRNSELDDACDIVEFNATDSKKITSVFWKVGEGKIGIGTELNSAGASNTNVYNAWKLICKVLMNEAVNL